jgi:hypothetical protein
MIKITKKLIKEILKLKNPCDEDYNVLKRFIFDNLLIYQSGFEKNDLVLKALKKYNAKEDIIQ